MVCRMKKYEFKLTPAYCLYNGIAVMEQQGSKICFITDNPENSLLRERIIRAFNNYLGYVLKQDDCPLEYKTKPSIKFVGGSRAELRKAVSKLYSAGTPQNLQKVSGLETSELKKMADEAAAVLLLDTIMADARSKNATDIHIEKNKVKFRIYGKLEIVYEFSPEKSRELIQRIKFLAGMNVLENRRSQDGHFVYGKEAPVFVRVSVMAIIGEQSNESEESVAIRLLDTKRLPLSLERLGFNKLQFSKIKKINQNKYGLVIICGPTGAGKSTTAASILIDIERQHQGNLKIISLEDPPEYLIPGVTQIKIDEKLNNSFSNALMHVFRQDPDVLMIGEIRDEKSAAVAVRAALTGHLVIATLHAATAGGVILRLENLGVPRRLIVSVLKAVIAQELNNFKGSINLIADVSVPGVDFETVMEQELSEIELDKAFEHCTNYCEVLEKTIGILKKKHSVKDKQTKPSLLILPKKNDMEKMGV